jgi:hypothetical protein
MGCDIHLYREKYVDGKWVSADEWQIDDGDLTVPYEKLAYTGRNYCLFGFLSDGVRTHHDFSFLERGIPFDACQQIAECSDRWNSDGHSHSYLFLHELKSAASFLGDKTVKISGMMDEQQHERLQKSIADGSVDWNDLYPYCKSTNAPNHVDFEFDVPALFSFGECLGRIIDSFNGINGDNHRIVFFFDN